MTRDVKLRNLESVLTAFDYPCSRDDVIEQCQDVTLVLADGTENLAEIVSRSDTEQFDSEDELSSEVMNRLPRHAVGEPYQSEGEG